MDRSIHIIHYFWTHFFLALYDDSMTIRGIKIFESEYNWLKKLDCENWKLSSIARFSLGFYNCNKDDIGHEQLQDDGN